MSKPTNSSKPTGCGPGGGLALVCLLLVGCAGSRPGTPEAPSYGRSAAARALDAALGRPDQANALWSVYAVRAADPNGRAVYAYHPDRSLIPASNTKLYTTAAALHLLGPGFRYETGLYLDGVVHDSTFVGTVFVRGSGDPTISGRFFDGDNTYVFSAWADSLRALGIRRIDGDLVGDDDLFDDLPYGSGWMWDDEITADNPELSALSFNENLAEFQVEPGRIGEAARVSWSPHNTDYLRVTNSTQTVEADSTLREGYERKRASNDISVWTRIPADTVEVEWLTVHNPTAYFVHVLRDVLESGGIAVAGYPLDIDDVEAARFPRPVPYDALSHVTTYRSPPLSEMIRVVNGPSNNFYAEQLLRTMGTREVGPGAAATDGLRAARRVWVQAGVDTLAIKLVDGSGLSRYNLTTARSTVNLLTYMAAGPDSLFAPFLDSLPVAGVRGTLERRSPSGRARGNARAKTGTLSNVSTLSGYVRSLDGELIAFSIQSNNFTTATSASRAIQDQIVEILASTRLDRR